jgi:superoxide dismutase
MCQCCCRPPRLARSRPARLWPGLPHQTGQEAKPLSQKSENTNHLNIGCVGLDGTLVESIKSDTRLTPARNTRKGKGWRWIVVARGSLIINSELRRLWMRTR